MKRFKKIFLKILIVLFSGIFSFLATANVIEAASATKTLWVPQYYQGDTNWCWATSAKMVGDYLYGSRGSILDIVYKITGSRDVLRAGSKTETLKAVNYASNYGNNYILADENHLGYWRYATSINNGKPYVLLIENNRINRGHAIVGRGYKWVENGNSSDVHYIYINDPAKGTSYVNYAQFTSGVASGYRNWQIKHNIMANGKY